MKIAEIIESIEEFAPLSYQESYDNAGLIVGDKQAECSGALLCLDAVEDVLDEAIRLGYNLVIAHHPIVFSGLKKITGRNYVERVLLKAIKNDIALYAAHTNLDNVLNGVNRQIADQLGLKNCRILSPKKNILKKLYTYITVAEQENLKNALFAAGAGQIGHYSECSFTTEGIGTFKGDDTTSPFVGEKQVRSKEPEVKIEVIFPAYRESKVLAALFRHHPYEEVAYEVIALDNSYQEVGSGLIGELNDPMPEAEFLAQLKSRMATDCIRHTRLLGKPVKKVAVCGGSGSFLLGEAIAAGADLFISGDFKYHQFFDADNQIVIADIGHYESEQFTPRIFHTILTNKFPNFAVRISGINTNPINYL